MLQGNSSSIELFYRANNIRSLEEEGGAGPQDWTLIADRINKRFKYKPGKDAFLPIHYLTYEDWFLRQLSPATLERCFSQAALADVCSPVQGKAWEQAGHRTDQNKIERTPEHVRRASLLLASGAQR